jgi:hypothetical protein
MPFARIVFRIAAAWGLLVLVPFLVMGVHMDGRSPHGTHEFFYFFVCLALVCQFLFFVIATDPKRYRTIMLPAIAAKLTYIVVVPILYLLHRVSPYHLIWAANDLILCLLFVAAYVKTPIAVYSEVAAPLS